LADPPVSIGVAPVPNTQTLNARCTRPVDAQLYVAKNEGRDRIAVAPLLQAELPTG
jgi:GGDEF domain-containing protein